jgi:hypothetical protein
MKVDVTCNGNGYEVELTPGGFFLVFDAEFTGTGFVPTAEAGLIRVMLGSRIGVEMKSIEFDRDTIKFVLDGVSVEEWAQQLCSLHPKIRLYTIDIGINIKEKTSSLFIWMF